MVKGAASIDRRQAAAVLVGLSVALLALSLPAFRPLSSFFSNSALDAFDFGGLSYQVHAGRGFFAQSGRLWGYDPYFLGGYVLGFDWNSNVFIQVISLLLVSLAPGAVLKAVVVLVAGIWPWLIYVGWRGFGSSREQALVGALAGIFWFRLSMAFVLWTVGMIGSCLVFVLSFAGLGLTAALLRGEKRGRWLLLLAPLSLLVHKTAAITLAPGVLMMVAWSRRRLDKAKVGILLGAFVLTLVVNLFWILPLWRYLPFISFAEAPTYWVNRDPLAWWRDLTDPNSTYGVVRRQGFWGDMLFCDLVLAGALVGVWRQRRQWRANGFCAATAVVGLLSYGGSFIGALGFLDPNYYVPYFYLLLTVPALSWMVGSRGGALRAGAAVLAAGVLLSSLPSVGRYFYSHPIRTDPSPQLRDMAEWINRLPLDGRVHVETFSSFQKEAEPVPWNEQMARVSQMLPMQTRTPLLGGHYSGVITKYNAVNFYSGQWMGAPLDEWTEERLRERLRRYHVSHILTWSKTAERGLSRHPGLVERIEAPSPFAGWRVLDNGNWFLEGSGRLANYDYDKLVFDQVTVDGRRAVVSFHWAPTLRAQGAKIVPVTLPEDPVPFIGLVDAEERVVITNGGAW